MSLIIQLGALTFKGRRDYPRDGFYVDAGTFTGWDDSVDVRLDADDIPLQPGTFDEPEYPTDRTIGWNGRCYANTPEKLEWYGGAFRGTLARPGLTRLTVANRGVTGWADVKRSAKPTFAVEPGGAIFARYRITMLANDPRKYGETRVFASGDAAFHRGNFDADPIFTITGANAGGYTINGPSGKTVTVTKPLVSGHPHTYNMRRGQLIVDGAVVFSALTSADRWQIGPGQSVVMTLSGSGASMAAAVLDTSL